MSIEWKEGAVCFAYGKQWFARDSKDNDLIDLSGCGFASSSNVVTRADLQLNNIKQGDYIEALELNTEQKYNDAVDVFGLFGWSFPARAVSDYEELKGGDALLCSVDFEVYQNARGTGNRERKLTYPQLMVIGKLKRAMIESDESNDSELPNSSNYKTSKDYLNECIEVQNQRGEQYDSKGTGERSFAAAASAFNAMTGQNLKGSDVCLLLSCVKAVRQYSDPTRVHEDSLLDLVSYASLWAEELNKELK